MLSSGRTCWLRTCLSTTSLVSTFRSGYIPPCSACAIGGPTELIVLQGPSPPIRHRSPLRFPYAGNSCYSSELSTSSFHVVVSDGKLLIKHADVETLMLLPDVHIKHPRRLLHPYTHRVCSEYSSQDLRQIKVQFSASTHIR